MRKEHKSMRKAGVSNYVLVVDIEGAKALSSERGCQFQQEQGGQDAQGKTKPGKEDSGWDQRSQEARLWGATKLTVMTLIFTLT